MEMACKRRKSFLNRILDSLSCTEEYELTLPAGIVERAELMCLYVTEEVGEKFGLSEFLFLLYKDFIYYAVKNPVPKRILQEASRKTISNKVKPKKKDDEYIKIVCDGVEYLERPIDYKEKSKDNSFENKKIVNIKMDKLEAKKGEIILEELYTTMGVRITMEELLGSLWINFIEDYRNGVNKRAYKSIVTILKRVGLK